MATDKVTQILVAVEGLSKDMGHNKDMLIAHVEDEREWRRGFEERNNKILKEAESKFSAKWVEWVAKGAVGTALTTIAYKIMQLIFMSGGAVTTFHLINKYYA